MALSMPPQTHNKPHKPVTTTTTTKLSVVTVNPSLLAIASVSFIHS